MSSAILSYDCILIIVLQLDVKDAYSAAIGLSESSDVARKLIHVRLSPLRLLSRLTSKPATLFESMAQYGCILIGSKCMSYFHPNTFVDDQHWKFVTNGKANIDGMEKALASCGVEWECDVRYKPHMGDEIFRLNSYTGIASDNNRKDQHVTLINSEMRNPIDVVLSSPFSILQSFMTPSCFVHMYGRLTNKYQIEFWNAIARRRSEFIENANDEYCMHKRRFNEIAWTHISESITENLLSNIVDGARVMLNEKFTPDELEDAMFFPHNHAKVAEFDDAMESFILSNEDWEYATTPFMCRLLVELATRRCTCIHDDAKTGLSSYMSMGYDHANLAKWRWNNINCRVRHPGDTDATFIPLTQYGLDDTIANAGMESVLSYKWFEFHSAAVSYEDRDILENSLGMSIEQLTMEDRHKS